MLIIHGYTGSTDEFHDIAGLLAERLGAFVSVPLLVGHGTREEDLLSISFNDLLADVKKYVEAIEGDKPLAIIGHSFGAYLALLAPSTPPAALVLAIMPFALKFPFSFPGAEYIARLKTFWDKKLSPYELNLRKHLFFYPHMPGMALGLVKEGIRRCKKLLPSVAAPIFAISTAQDPFSSRGSGLEILAMSGRNQLNRHMEIIRNAHRVFYGAGAGETNNEIADFLELAFRAAEKKS